MITDVYWENTTTYSLEAVLARLAGAVGRARTRLQKHFAEEKSLINMEPAAAVRSRMMSSRKKLPMTRQNADRDLAKGAIQLSSDQEQAIREAIQSGIIRSVDEFIEMAIAALRRPENQNENARRDAVRLMEEFGEKYHLSMGGPVTRESLHKGHRY